MKVQPDLSREPTHVSNDDSSKSYGRDFRDRDSRDNKRNNSQSQQGQGRRWENRDDRGPRRDDRGFGDRGARRDGDGQGRRWENRDDRGPRRDNREAPPVASLPIPEGLEFSMLNRDARARLRGLSKENAEFVGLHLIAAGQLVDTDPELAYKHAQEALKRGGRVDIVR